MKTLSKLFTLTCVLFSINLYAELPVKAETIYTEKNTNILVSPSAPQFTFKLKSNLTTGYSWFLRDYDSRLIKLVKHQYIPNTNKKMVGAGGSELWTFKVLPAGFIAPQQTMIRFSYARPWEGAESATQLVFEVSTSEINLR